MYAVVATGGKQYKVKVGDELEVEKLIADEDGGVALRPVMVVGDDGAVLATPDALSGATVSASVLETFRGKKVEVFMYRNKTGYRRKSGHRQTHTRVRVDDISL